MTSCPDCSHRISSSAKACPKCGCDIQERRRLQREAELAGRAALLAILVGLGYAVIKTWSLLGRSSGGRVGRWVAVVALATFFTIRFLGAVSDQRHQPAQEREPEVRRAIPAESTQVFDSGLDRIKNDDARFLESEGAEPEVRRAEPVASATPEVRRALPAN